MKIFIQSSATISMRNSAEESGKKTGLEKRQAPVIALSEIRFADYIQPKLMRRMSRIIRQSLAAAKIALRDAAVEEPGAILAGTGLGCMTDTEHFLTDLCKSEEGILSPTAFIQSTHNTIAGQIGLHLNCNAYNATYSDRSQSFEQALLDAQLHLAEGQDNLLVGAADESTHIVRETSNSIHGIDGSLPENEELIPGEACSFFVLSDTRKENSVELKGMTLLPKLSRENLTSKLMEFLAEEKLPASAIDLIVFGDRPGTSDGYYRSLKENFDSSTPIVFYKLESGEYFTSAAYGLATAVHILKSQEVPPSLLHSGDASGRVQNILVYNHYKTEKHSFFLLSK